MNPLFNFFDLFRVPNFQEHKWTSIKIEYYTLSESNYMRLKSKYEDRRGNDNDLREVKYFAINNPEDVQKAMSLIQVKDWWPMSVGVQRGTEVHDEAGNIWDMTISPIRIYIAKRGTTASYGFEVNNDFAYYIRKLAFENEKRINPNAKIEYIGLTCFNVCILIIGVIAILKNKALLHFIINKIAISQSDTFRKQGAILPKNNRICGTCHVRRKRWNPKIRTCRKWLCEWQEFRYRQS